MSCLRGRVKFPGLGLLAVLLVAGCGKKEPPPALSLPIYFTCDTDGRIQPCGCSAGQFGGMTRLKTVLDSYAPNVGLRLDAGDAAGGHQDYDFIEYRYVLRAFGVMNYDALNIGQHEAQFSAAQLRSIAKDSPVPIISANLLDQSTGQPIFDSYRIVQRGPYHIGIIGVVDPRGLEQNIGAGLAIGDINSAVSRAIAELRGRTDMIVLLAFTDEATLNSLADEFFECNVILGGKVTQPAQDLFRENRSVIYYVTNESRALGILTFNLTKDAAPKATGNEIRLLYDTIPQDSAIRGFVQQYRDEVRNTRLAIDDAGYLSADMVPGVRKVATYVGSEKCVACHQSAAAIWSASAHSRAFATLVSQNADADPRCIACHTVGFGDPSGYHRDLHATALVNVGCESCHGPGSLHVRQENGDSSISFTFRPLDSGDCQKCHQGEFSRPFDWTQFWPLVKHGKEPPLAGIQPPSISQ